jgi:F-type H+-transporting ATPase subunit b
MTHIYSTPDFWFAISFIIFIFFAYKPIRAKMFSALDERSRKIKQQIEEMDRLISDAGQTLAEIKAKYDAIDIELNEIASNTEKEIELLRKNSEREITQYVSQKTHQVMDRMAADERKALEVLRADSVKLAVRVASQIIKDSADKKFVQQQVEQALDNIKEKV